jgi:hypothetical protein
LSTLCLPYQHILPGNQAKRRNVKINTHHFTIGFKICDKKARNPVTGKFLFPNMVILCDEEHIYNMYSGAQCFPILAVIAQDNKDIYEKYLRAIFEFTRSFDMIDLITTVKAGGSSE